MTQDFHSTYFTVCLIYVKTKKIHLYCTTYNTHLLPKCFLNYSVLLRMSLHWVCPADVMWFLILSLDAPKWTKVIFFCYKCSLYTMTTIFILLLVSSVLTHSSLAHWLVIDYLICDLLFLIYIFVLQHLIYWKLSEIKTVFRVLWF